MASDADFKADFAAVASAAAAQADTLVPAWLPGGKRQGSEYLVHSVWRDEKTPSLSVSVAGARVGKWGDFGGTDKGNDLVSLYAAVRGLEPWQACKELALQLGVVLRSVGGQGAGAPAASPPAAVRPAAPPPSPPQDPTTPPPDAAAAGRKADDEGWQTMTPVPPTAPAATFRHQYRQAADIVHTAEYRMGGQLLGYVVRFKTSDGGKETLPYTWCISARDGASRWAWRQWDVPRPLYVPLGTMPEGRTVVLVEGEKKAGMLQDLLEAGAPGVYLVVSWPGGCKAWKKAMWDWLKDCTVLLWPDCDAKRVPLTAEERKAYPDELARAAVQAAKPLLPAGKQVGMAAMLGIGGMLRDWKGCTVQLLPIPEPGEVSDGWDCADAIATDGWDFARVQALFAGATPLPADAGSNAPGGAAGAGAFGGEAGGGGGGGDGPPGEKIDDPADAPEPGARKIRGKWIPPWLQPYWDGDKERWLVSRKLVIAALEHDTELAHVLGLNELSGNIDARAAWPWLHGLAGPITGAADLLLGDHLTRRYGLPSIARAALIEAIETVAHARPFHPLRDYLKGLKHDGTQRMDKWLLYAIGETPESLPRAVVDYLVLVGRYWLLAMVNRVMQPGCKFDYCPVLEGAGGLGKSTMVEVLAGSEFFSDTHFDVTRGKEGQEQVQGIWLYELAELANFSKGEIGLIKAFISAKKDKYRPSYGRVVEEFLRQCVMVGTTNESTYLRDRTGNRRFWPIPVRYRIRIAWLTKMRDQLLAEAYVLYQQGVRYFPTPEEERALFVPMQESRLVETAVLSEMMNVLTRTPEASGIRSVVNGLTDFVTISQLTLALGVDAAKSNAALEGQIRSWLDYEGWPRVKKQINGARAWGYMRPANWPPADEPEPTLPPAPGAPGPSTSNDKGADDAPF